MGFVADKVAGFLRVFQSPLPVPIPSTVPLSFITPSSTVYGTDIYSTIK
jgi:hypothetical protein